MGNLTDVQLKAWIKARKPLPGRSDGGGLTFTLSNGGAASWVFRYRIGGRQKELSLGRYPDLGIKQARELAAQKRVEVASHQIDVAAAKQRRKAEQRLAGTVTELAEEYLNATVRSRHKYPKVTERVFENDILPAIGSKAPGDITTRDVTRVLAKIRASGRPTVANDALRHVKALFRYAQNLDLVDRNPAEPIKQGDAGGKEDARTRTLTRSELAQLFKAMREAGPSFTRDNELAVKLLLVLAVRKMELLGAKWEEFDLDHSRWRLSGDRTKTGDSLEIHLPDQAVAWLRELHVRACGSEYVFPARRTGKRQPHVSPDTLNAALNKLKHALQPFTVHDLRRTARSLLA